MQYMECPFRRSLTYFGLPTEFEELYLRRTNQSSGMAKELARNTKSKLLLLVRYCYMK